MSVLLIFILLFLYNIKKAFYKKSSEKLPPEDS